MVTLDDRIARFEAIKPQLATMVDIEAGRHLIDEISQVDVGKKVTLLGKLGSFYLESQAGDPMESLEAAKRCYEEVMTIACTYNIDEWILIGSSGLANTVARQYVLSQILDDLDVAEAAYSYLIEQLDKLGMIKESTSNRINYANLLMTAAQGDRFSHIDKAITLLRQALHHSSRQSLGQRFNPDRYGRILHNLGTALTLQTEEPDRRTLFLNEAIDLFHQALLFRSPEHDPVGRVRTLRALGNVLPEWAGADSLAHARELSEEVIAKAEALEKGNTIQERAGWANAKRSWSALHWEEIDKIAQDRAFLEGEIKDHIIKIQQIPRDSLPYLWADWVGGYALLVGRIGVEDNNVVQLNESCAAFLNAIDAVPEERDPRLCLILHRELGRIYHERGDWEQSLFANRRATDIGLRQVTIARISVARTNELETFTRAIHFATFAASQLKRVEEAVELAEIGRARWMDEAILLASIRRSSLPPEFKAKVDEAHAALLELERYEQYLLDQGTGGMARRLENYFGIPLGGTLKIRLTADPNGTEEKLRNELTEVRARIYKARENLGILLDLPSNDDVLLKRLSCNQIMAIAQKVGFPLVYLLSSSWGSIAIIVGQKVEILSIPDLNRQMIKDLLYGENSYVKLCAQTIDGDLEASLQAIQKLLDEHIISPLTAWSRENNIETFGIIGLGDIGLLPIQVCTVPADLCLHVLPSARALTLSSSQDIVRDSSKIRLLTVGGLLSTNLPPLAFSRIESILLNTSYRNAGATVYDFSNAPTLAEIDTEITNSTHLHFACHGRFTPFSPFNSVIYLNGDEVLTAESLLRPTLRLASVELAILSACNSASTQSWTTPDEAIGFPATFLVAGAKTVVAAQWAVSDKATFLLIQQFCKELLHGGSDAAHSLAKAQRWLRNATTSDIHEAINQISDTLGDNEMRAKRLLRELQDDLKSISSECPFIDRKFWAAFVCVGS